MDDAERFAGVGIQDVVRVPEPLGDLHDDVDDLADGQALADAAPPFEDRREVDALDVLHHDEIRLVGVADVEHLDDVGVLQVQRQPRLVEEHGHELLVLGQRGKDALDGDALPEALQGLGHALEDFGHTTRDYAFGDSIAALGHGTAGATRLAKLYNEGPTRTIEGHSSAAPAERSVSPPPRSFPSSTPRPACATAASSFSLCSLQSMQSVVTGRARRRLKEMASPHSSHTSMTPASRRTSCFWIFPSRNFSRSWSRFSVEKISSSMDSSIESRPMFLSWFIE